MRFQGRVVMVTGAARGIGAAEMLARELTAQGAEALALKTDVTVSSIVGRAGSVLVTSHYAAAKAAVLGFTRHLALEVAGDGITVNAVAPGTIATERFKALRSPDETRRLAEQVPLHRIAEPAEVAESVLFLASDAARYITGATLDVNGGLLMM